MLGCAPQLLGTGWDVHPALTLGGLLLLFPSRDRFHPFGSFREVWGDIYILFFSRCCCCFISKRTTACIGAGRGAEAGYASTWQPQLPPHGPSPTVG